MCCGTNFLTNHNLFETSRDYVAVGVLVVALALLIIGGLVEKGIIPLPGTACSYFFGIGGVSFAVSALYLLVRGCCNQV